MLRPNIINRKNKMYLYLPLRQVQSLPLPVFCQANLRFPRKKLFFCLIMRIKRVDVMKWLR